ncbi:uncharacterized protein LOC106160501 [Lingula anatina]|uniref:Uncharacterized protein LOC106160501 n=1 Tax=Lingula anatina TaxID=7574 RepID=A0A2R2MQ29_LINAN|nr:uncharacterized protein LOC106160501 [Lingula anatina]|eukprot:XP_023932349.1 uncharacterized protein LOC106160501 [Lingula anatina]
MASRKSLLAVVTVLFWTSLVASPLQSFIHHINKRQLGGASLRCGCGDDAAKHRWEPVSDTCPMGCMTFRVNEGSVRSREGRDYLISRNEARSYCAEIGGRLVDNLIYSLQDTPRCWSDLEHWIQGAGYVDPFPRFTQPITFWTGGVVEQVLNGGQRIRVKWNGGPVDVLDLPKISVGTPKKGDSLVLRYSGSNRAVSATDHRLAFQFTNNGNDLHFPLCSRNCSVDICDDPTDVMFILDASSSVLDENFEKMKAFVKEVIHGWEIGTVRAGMITYALPASTKLEFDLKTYLNKQDLLAAVDEVFYTSCPPEAEACTATGNALRLMRQTMTQNRAGIRNDAPKIAIILTDGNTNIGLNSTEEAIRAKAEGIAIYAVGIGPDIDYEELVRISAFEPKRVAQTTFGLLPTLIKSVSKRACRGDCVPVPSTTCSKCMLRYNCEANKYSIPLQCPDDSSINVLGFCNAGDLTCLDHNQRHNPLLVFARTQCDGKSECKLDVIQDCLSPSPPPPLRVNYMCCESTISLCPCPCSPNPCNNGGQCTPLTERSYKCACRPGFTGLNCETPLFCADSPCLNGGTCQARDDGWGYYCDCPVGYYGFKCQHARTCTCACAPNPCQNGGECSVGERGGPSCKCRPGFTGALCQTSLICRGSNPCQNGGSCVVRDDGFGYWCECPFGYYGYACQHKQACLPNPCVNGGTCMSLSTGGYTCSCYPWFTGENCEKSQICDPNPCINGGRCVSSHNGHNFYCDCEFPFFGEVCQLSFQDYITTLMLTSPIVIGATGPPGPAGPTGPTGPSGSDGEPGPSGQTGSTGRTGARGETGQDGDDGPVGPTGPTGDRGPIGETGPAGPQGLRGDRGSTGVSGETGSAGRDGEPGRPGSTGSTGPQGPAGGAGPQGPTGPAGPRGQQGEMGETGAPGPAGATGEAGPKGDSGAPGEPGRTGAPGPTGAQGVSGASGSPGKDGNQGPTGSAGPQGPRGPTGTAGATGAPGEQGAQGRPGMTGARGETGPRGAVGPPGPAGSAGPSGKGKQEREVQREIVDNQGQQASLVYQANPDAQETLAQQDLGAKLAVLESVEERVQQGQQVPVGLRVIVDRLVQEALDPQGPRDHKDLLAALVLQALMERTVVLDKLVQKVLMVHQAPQVQGDLPVHRVLLEIEAYPVPEGQLDLQALRVPEVQRAHKVVLARLDHKEHKVRQERMAAQGQQVPGVKPEHQELPDQLALQVHKVPVVHKEDRVQPALVDLLDREAWTEHLVLLVPQVALELGDRPVTVVQTGNLVKMGLQVLLDKQVPLVNQELPGKQVDLVPEVLRVLLDHKALLAQLVHKERLVLLVLQAVPALGVRTEVTARKVIAVHPGPLDPLEREAKLALPAFLVRVEKMELPVPKGKTVKMDNQAPVARQDPRGPVGNLDLEERLVNLEVLDRPVLLVSRELMVKMDHQALQVLQAPEVRQEKREVRVVQVHKGLRDRQGHREIQEWLTVAFQRCIAQYLATADIHHVSFFSRFNLLLFGPVD